MTTGTELVQDALQKIGVHSPLQPASPEALQAGFKRLTSMIAEWQDDDIETGAVPIEVIGDDVCEPLGAKNAIIYQLALLCAPDFPGAQVSTELSIQANKSYSKLKRRWKTISIPKPQVRPFPAGQGNQRYRSKYDDVFFEDGDEIG